VSARGLPLGVVLVAALAAMDGAAQHPLTPRQGVYHADPMHLWNRLHDALFVRVGPNGHEYGRDRVEPLLWRASQHLIVGDSHERLLSVLAEFNRGGEALIADPLKRAMLQRDLWLVFSWVEHGHDNFYGFPAPKEQWAARREALRPPLARAIARLALTPQQIGALPDTYAAAVASREFADRFDPALPDRPYLPPDLFADEGPWVSVGRGADLITPSHVLSDNPFTTSAFLVFIKLPGGRAATRAYVERLRAFRGPLFVATRELGPVFPNYNPAIPQFPALTEVALVRRALLVTSTFEIAVSPLIENVQIRAYRQVPVIPPGQSGAGSMVDGRAQATLGVSEFLVSRVRLFAGRSGGLRAVVDDEGDFLTGFSTHGMDPFEPRPGDSPMRPPDRPDRVRSRLIDKCVWCHALPGVFSFNTFAQNFPAARGPNTYLSMMPVSDVLASGVAWKRTRDDWVLLQRLLRAANTGR
jgi:hypothetical protein